MALSPIRVQGIEVCHLFVVFKITNLTFIYRDFLQLYKIQTIPAIKLIGADGEVADDNVRVKIEKNHSDPEKSKQIVAEWKKKLGIE